MAKQSKAIKAMQSKARQGVFPLPKKIKMIRNYPYYEIRERAQMSKAIIAVKHFALGGRESLEISLYKTWQFCGCKALEVL